MSKRELPPPTRKADIVAVRRPENIPQLPFECVTILYPNGTREAGYSFWTADARVSNAVSAIDNMPLAMWVCKTLNENAIAEQVFARDAA